METAPTAGCNSRGTGNSREELTATVLQKYLQNNHPEFEPLEIRHSEQGEQLHGEVGKLSYAFLFLEDLIQFDIFAKRKGGRELEEKLERIGKKVPGVQFQYVKEEGRVYASGYLTKELTPKQAIEQVFLKWQTIFGDKNGMFRISEQERRTNVL